MATKAATAPAPKPEKANVFVWEGTDRKGNRVKGETRAATIALARADLRRQGLVAYVDRLLAGRGIRFVLVAMPGGKDLKSVV